MHFPKERMDTAENNDLRILLQALMGFWVNSETQIPFLFFRDEFTVNFGTTNVWAPPQNLQSNNVGFSLQGFFMPCERA